MGRLVEMEPPMEEMAKPAMMAIRKRKPHVLVEKPLAPSVIQTAAPNVLLSLAVVATAMRPPIIVITEHAKRFR